MLASLLCLPATSQAQLDFQFRNAKAGYQTGPKFLAYEGGRFEVSLKDGSFSSSFCLPANPGAGPVNPGIVCPLGTNSYIFGYGEAAGMTGHWSLAAAPVKHQYFAINRPDLFQLLSAPPSLLVRSELLPRIDRSLNIGYSYTEPPYEQYRIAEYVHRQTFLPTPSDRARHDATVPHGRGTYIFGYPQIQTTAQINAGMEPRIIPVPVDTPQMPESYPGLTESPIKSGFRFINGMEHRDGRREDGYWNAGRLELDPVFEMNIAWEGLLNNVNVNMAADQLTMWVERTRSLTPLDAPNDANVLYPIPRAAVPYLVPPENALLGTETLPPFYFEWSAGDEVVLYLRYDRNALATATVKDSSFRVWALPIRFITTFRGFAFTSLPPDTPEALREPNADYDLDGFSNFLEYAANTDPDDITSTPPPGFPNLTSTLVGGKLSATVAKRPNVGGSLIYNLEWSTDMVTWTPIDKVADPVWDVTESNTQLTATAKVAGTPPVGFLRARLTLVH